jgi:hypothetical protein
MGVFLPFVVELFPLWDAVCVLQDVEEDVDVCPDVLDFLMRFFPLFMQEGEDELLLLFAVPAFEVCETELTKDEEEDANVDPLE